MHPNSTQQISDCQCLRDDIFAISGMCRIFHTATSLGDWSGFRRELHSPVLPGCWQDRNAVPGIQLAGLTSSPSEPSLEVAL